MEDWEFYLNANNQAQLLSGLPAQSAAADVFSLLLATGMRAAELRGLRWNSVDLTNRTLRVYLSKSGAARIIPMTNTVLDILKRWSSTTGTNEFVLGENPSTLLRKCLREWGKAAGSLGIPAPCCNDLRRAFACKLMNSGDSVALAYLLGVRPFTSISVCGGTPSEARLRACLAE